MTNIKLAALKAQGVVMPERWNVPRPMWKDARQPYGNPLNHADIEAAEKFNLALDEVARLNSAPVQRVSVQGGLELIKRMQVCLSLDDTEWGYSAPEKYKLLADIKSYVLTAALADLPQ